MVDFLEGTRERDKIECSVGVRVLLKTKYIEASDMIEVVCERKEEN